MVYQEILPLCVAAIGVAGTAVLVMRMSRAERRLRSLRLSAFELRIRRRTQQLDAILVAENARLVARGIDQGSILMQGGHRLISEVTFALLDRIPATRTRARAVREAHNLVSAGLYGAVREINRQVTGRMAASLQEPAASRRSSARLRKVHNRVKKRVAKKTKR